MGDVEISGPHTAMEGLRLVDRFRLSGNIAENWKKFKQYMNLFIQATASVERTVEEEVAMLRDVAGKKAAEVYIFKFKKWEFRIYEALSQKTNETYGIHVFRIRQQQEGEFFVQFFRDVQLGAQSRKFGDLSSSMITERIMYTVTVNKLEERLLRETDLTLEAIQMCQTAEIAEK